MPDNDLEVLRELSFGERVAEEEVAELSKYFVQTEQWRQLFAGEVDVVYGFKGTGKSALYSTLLNRKDELLDRSILMTAGENVRGTPVFRDLVDDPPSNEQEFRYLWKLYFLQLVGLTFREHSIDSKPAKRLLGLLEEEDLLPKKGGLQAFVRSALDYVRRLVAAPESILTTLELDPITQQPKAVSGRITFREPSQKAAKAGYISTNTLFELANEILEEHDASIWILLDRLDVAFADNEHLEYNALRALFTVYADLRNYERITPKIFLRSDIWDKITAKGFREASHVTRAITISWENDSLMNLIIKRALQSPLVAKLYGIKVENVLGNVEEQSKLFYRIFPEQVDIGLRRPSTFDWMLTRTQDGYKKTAPRELIHLLSASRNVQLKKVEIGESLPSDERLIVGQNVKEALKEVSTVRLEQTLLAEYPTLRPQITKLKNAKTQQSLSSLALIWECSEREAAELATSLVEIGFFERRGSDYWVPFLYRDALEMSQGAAE